MRVAAFHASRHLAAHELGDELDRCPICDGGDRVALSLVQHHPDVALHRCRRCWAVSVSRFPTTAALDAYYATYYDGAGEAAVTADDPARLARRIAAHVPDRPELAVLDFGGGDGSVGVATLVAAHRPGSVDVVDYDHRRQAVAPAGTTLAFHRQLDDVGGRTFDLVVASAVLEHLPEPLPVLRQLLARVAPGGTFYARTPYAVPLITAASRVGLSFDFTFPAHLHDMGQPFWDHLLDWSGIEGFTVLGSRPSPVETGLRAHPGRTVAAVALKAPWRLLGRRWPYVGGWEVAMARRAGPMAG